MDKTDLLNLEAHLSFPLYVCAKDMIRRYKPFLDEIGLTYTQYITMLVLWERQPLTVKKLGGYLHLDSGTLTPLLKKLEAAGLIQRQRDLQDERSIIITVTDQGMNLRKQAVTIPSRMHDHITLAADEVKILHALLYKLLGKLAEESR